MGIYLNWIAQYLAQHTQEDGDEGDDGSNHDKDDDKQKTEDERE